LAPLASKIAGPPDDVTPVTQLAMFMSAISAADKVIESVKTQSRIFMAPDEPIVPPVTAPKMTRLNPVGEINSPTMVHSSKSVPAVTTPAGNVSVVLDESCPLMLNREMLSPVVKSVIANELE